MNRNYIIQGLSMAMTLQNTIEWSAIGGTNLLSNGKLSGATPGDTWENPFNADPKAVETVSGWYINNGIVVAAQNGLRIERYSESVAGSGFFMQHFPKTQLEIFLGKLCAIGAVVNGRTYTAKVEFLPPSPNAYFMVDFGKFRIRFHYYVSPAQDYSGFTVDVKEDPIILSNIYWSLASENWSRG